LNQRGNITPHAPLQWCSDANCCPGVNIQMHSLSTPHICLQQYKMKEIHVRLSCLLLLQGMIKYLEHHNQTEKGLVFNS